MSRKPFQFCFGRALRAERNARGICGKAMAFTIGVAPNTYVQIESGHRALSVARIPVVLRALGAEVCAARFVRLYVALCSMDKLLDNAGVPAVYRQLDYIEAYDVELAALGRALMPLACTLKFRSRRARMRAIEHVGAHVTIRDYWQARERRRFIFPDERPQETLPLAA